MLTTHNSDLKCITEMKMNNPFHKINVKFKSQSIFLRQ